MRPEIIRQCKMIVALISDILQNFMYIVKRFYRLTQTIHVIRIEELEAVDHVIEYQRLQQIVADVFKAITKASRD